MNLVIKHNFLPIARQQPNHHVDMVVLHHTAGPTLNGAEVTLKQRGLGYHYMIGRDGTCYEYATPSVKMNHAIDFNSGTVAISFVGGGGSGAVNEAQIAASIELIRDHIKSLQPSIKVITGHKHCNPGRKIDPQFQGEPSSNVNLRIDKQFMDRIASETGLTFQSSFD